MSVEKKPYGGVWPLGNIVVPVPGTSVPITSLVAAPVAGIVPGGDLDTTTEYNTLTAQAILFQAVKAGAAPPALTANTGKIYIVRRGGSKTDLGSIIAVLDNTPALNGEKFLLTAAALNRNVLSLLDFAIDADTANDACQVTAMVQ